MLLAELTKLSNVEVALEPTGSYGDALRWQLESRGIEVYRVNPKHTHDYSESFDGWPGLHDAKAAHVITELHLHGRSNRWSALAEGRRGDQCLLMELGIHQQNQQSNRNRLSALMVWHWPELGEVAQLDTVSVLSLLQAYGSPVGVLAAPEEAEVLLQRMGRSGLKADKRQAIMAAAVDSLGAPGQGCLARRESVNISSGWQASCYASGGLVRRLSDEWRNGLKKMPHWQQWRK